MTETLSKWEARAERARQNRVAMPIVTTFVDELRREFGDLIHVRYANEAGIEYGRRGPEGVIATQPDPLPATEPKHRVTTRYRKDAPQPAPVAALF